MWSTMERLLAEMLDVQPENLPAELVRRCIRVEELIRRAKHNGELVSSQVLAAIVEQWQRERRGDS